MLYVIVGNISTYLLCQFIFWNTAGEIAVWCLCEFDQYVHAVLYDLQLFYYAASQFADYAVMSTEMWLQMN